MTKFTLRQLEYFTAVARHGSISRAAAAEHVSRSAISVALDELEKALGSTLCVRTKTHGIQLTQNGEEVLKSAQSILGEVGDLQQFGGQKELQGTLTVGCFPSLAPTLIPLLWVEYGRLFPKVSLQVVTGSRTELVAMLEKGAVDLIIAYDLHVFSGVATASVYETNMHAILAPGHPLAGANDFVSAAELASEPLLLMDISPSVEDVLGYFSRLGIVPRVELRSAHFELIRSLVARGVGYSLFLQRPGTTSSYEGLPVRPMRIEPCPPSVEATIGWVHGNRLPRRAAAFVDLLLEHADSLAPDPL